MRAIETSRVLSWRWAPCVALVLAAFCFAAFAMLVIPDHIGGAAPSPGSAAFQLGSLASTQSGADSASRTFSSDSSSGTSTFSALPSNPGGSRAGGNLFPKRGFTPPLERPEAPPPPPPPVSFPGAAPSPPVDAPPPVAMPVPPPPDAPAQLAPPPQDPQAAGASLGEQSVRSVD